MVRARRKRVPGRVRSLGADGLAGLGAAVRRLRRTARGDPLRPARVRALGPPHGIVLGPPGSASAARHAQDREVRARRLRRGGGVGVRSVAGCAGFDRGHRRGVAAGERVPLARSRVRGAGRPGGSDGSCRRSRGAIELQLAVWAPATSKADPGVRKVALENAAAQGIDPSWREAPPPAVDRLDQLRAAALLVVGEEDIAEVGEIADLVAERVPGASKRVVAEADQLVNVSKPERFTGSRSTSWCSRVEAAMARMETASPSSTAGGSRGSRRGRAPGRLPPPGPVGLPRLGRAVRRVFQDLPRPAPGLPRIRRSSGSSLGSPTRTSTTSRR